MFNGASSVNVTASPQSMLKKTPPVHLRHVAQWHAPAVASLGVAEKATAPHAQLQA
jgi:hypothetical protein